MSKAQVVLDIRCWISWVIVLPREGPRAARARPRLEVPLLPPPPDPAVDGGDAGARVPGDVAGGHAGLPQPHDPRAVVDGRGPARTPLLHAGPTSKDGAQIDACVLSARGIVA